MKKIKNTDYMNSNPTSGSMIYDRSVTEENKKKYINKNLNEKHLQNDDKMIK